MLLKVHHLRGICQNNSLRCIATGDLMDLVDADGIL